VQQAIDLEQDRRFSGFVTIDGFWRGIAGGGVFTKRTHLGLFLHFCCSPR
jgi:hypothetical protein